MSKKFTLKLRKERKRREFYNYQIHGEDMNGKVIYFLDIGRWSEYSDVWSEELREQLNFQKADDGLFWIGIDDFV